MTEVCKHCGKSFKRLMIHMKNSHPSLYGKGGAAAEENSSSAPPQTKAINAVEKIRFFSSRSPGLTLVIRPKRRGFVNTSGGSIETIVDEGKRVQFRNGVLETSDPEVINFIKTEYKDYRFPITNVSHLNEAAK
jgi:hypothetical protein